MRSPEDTPTDADQLIRFGVIASVDLSAGRCIVSLDDESRSPPIRWIERRAGRTRTWSPPSQGEQVVLLCPGGEIGAAVALRGLFSSACPAPGNDEAELIEFEDGAVFSYDPKAHALACILPAGGTAEITAPGGFTLVGDLVVRGKVSADGDVLSGSISLSRHRHSGVSSGSSQSGGPL
ncbi:phage baseplate assembly protein V [Novosphingobium pituita]|uniref:Gp5/Type VI secretion system Vgr protein OB-fold domain-containing protein n=1 Tax=Novosphingobium pituita TaxID=3056842 RepID=A0ABQ6P4S0_9SPHN|nr:phage baseplate assembly protein V [Novosphingobium sp. IK01]GMM59855.1 hypothetical protein NUTIK01_06320 [Novosphingobium sp. IK01]